MADDTTQDAPQNDQQDAAAPDDLGDGGKKAIETERAARKEADRALRAAQRELEQVRQASMSEAEKAVAEAEVRGRQSAMNDVGKRLARSEFNAAAAKRNPDFDAASALDYLDLSRFVGEDGEPDVKAITAAVERLVPTASGRPSGDVGQGVRDGAGKGRSGFNGNQFLRQAAGLA